MRSAWNVFRHNVRRILCGCFDRICEKSQEGYVPQDTDYSFANIDKFSVSSIVTRLTTDVTNVQLAYMMIIRVAVRAPLMLIFSIAASCVINARLTLIFVAAIPILGFGLYLIATKSHPYFEKVFKIYDHLNGVVQENVSATRVVKSFVRQDMEMKKFGSVSGNIYRTFSKAEGTVAYLCLSCSLQYMGASF